MKKIIRLILTLAVILSVLPATFKKADAKRMFAVIDVTDQTPDALVFNIKKDAEDAFEDVETYCKQKEFTLGTKLVWLYRTSSTGAYEHLVVQMQNVQEDQNTFLKVVDITSQVNISVSNYTEVIAYVKGADAIQVVADAKIVKLDKVTADTYDFADLPDYCKEELAEEIGKQLLPNTTDGARLVGALDSGTYTYYEKTEGAWSEKTTANINSFLEYIGTNDVYVIGTCLKAINEVNFTQAPTKYDCFAADKETAISNSDAVIVFQYPIFISDAYEYITVIRATGEAALVSEITEFKGADIKRVIFLSSDKEASDLLDLMRENNSVTIPQINKGDAVVCVDITPETVEISKAEIDFSIPSKLPATTQGYTEYFDIEIVVYDTDGKKINCFNKNFTDKACSVGWILAYEEDLPINATLAADSQREFQPIEVGGLSWVGASEYIKAILDAYAKTSNEKYTFDPSKYIYGYGYEGMLDAHLFKITKDTKLYVNGVEEELPYRDYFEEGGYMFNTVTLGQADADGNLLVPRLITQDEKDCTVQPNGSGLGQYIIGKTSDTCMHISGIELDYVWDDGDLTNGYSGIVIKHKGNTLKYGADYTVEQGSVKIILSKTYLDTLDVGDNIFNVTVGTDAADFKFAINVKIFDKSVPGTGDFGDLLSMIQLSSAAALAYVGNCYLRRKKEQY